LEPRAVLTGLGPAQSAMLGDPRICVAVLDGPVSASHPCFGGANVRRLDTLVQDPAGQGPMSVHGTHVTSVIFGQPGSPVTGIAPRCQGLIAPVFQDSDQRHLSQLDLARAIEQAVQDGAHVINISGGEQAPEGQAEGVLERALRLCEDNNVLVVAAVGNDGCACLHVPAAVPSVLGVGALGADGKPLEISNWGEAYRSNGILTPGENIKGAAPGGGTVSLTGSSFATPIVSGVAALLLSAQVQQRKTPDPRAVGEALLQTAGPCHPRASPECRRYLVGTLNIPGAYASVTKGGRTVANINTTEAPGPAPGSVTAGTDTGTPETAGAGVTAAGWDPPAGLREAGAPDTAHGTPETGIAAASGGLPAEPATPQTTNLPSAPSSAVPAAPPASAQPSAPNRPPSGGVVPAGGCGCGGANGDCGCGDAKASYIYAIGTIGVDFSTEARRDTFRQLMPRYRIGESEPPVTVPPNPYDVTQLAAYLDDNKSESAKLIWTLNLDLTPIYAIEAESAYADEVYSALRSALRNQALPPEDDNYVSRVSIPGRLTGKTRRLFSGQVVPCVTAQHRGLYTWSERTLVKTVVDTVKPTDTTREYEEYVNRMVRTFLDKVYYQFRNLGQTSSDRALNFSATNAFIAAEGIADGLLSGKIVPAAGGEPEGLYSLDTIGVSKSPYCRMDSDCWDVRITFFDPTNVLRARNVYQFTIDVSDEMPVSLAPRHQFLMTA
jgi:cyanobactin maturation PatA/PatG family protease